MFRRELYFCSYLGLVRFLNESWSLNWFDKKYSKNRNIVKYCDKLKYIYIKQFYFCPVMQSRMFNVITPGFSVTISIEIILICSFPTFHYWLYPVWLCMWQIIKNLDLVFKKHFILIFNIFVETGLFSGLLFYQINASFFKIKPLLAPNFWMVVYIWKNPYKNSIVWLFNLVMFWSYFSVQMIYVYRDFICSTNNWKK